MAGQASDLIGGGTMNVTAEGLTWAGVGALFLMIAGHFLMRPIRWVFKIAFNSLLGLIMLWGTNLIGESIGFTLPINLVSALIVGFLGIPGLILLIVLRYLMV